MMNKIIVVLTATALSGCSSITSVEVPAGKNPADGLMYFMPKKDFQVTIKVKEKEKGGTGTEISQVTFGTTSSYPDLSKQYVLRYRKNLVGKNTLDANISEAGLLTSTTSTTISKLAEVLQNLAATAGTLTKFALKPPEKPEKPGEPCPVSVPCNKVGDHTFVLEARDTSCTICNMNITATKLGCSANIKPHTKSEGKKYSGIFYRQNIPYVITAVGNDLNVASLVFSPSESSVHFLPVACTLFSNNLADFEFYEGIPKKYNQDTDAEFVAISKIPADVIGAYFTGIGNVFDSFKSKSEKEAQALTESMKLELAKKKYDACISAINAGKDDLINRFCQ